MRLKITRPCDRCGEIPRWPSSIIICKCGESTKSYSCTTGDSNTESDLAVRDWNEGRLVPYVRPLERLLSRYNDSIDRIVESACKKLDSIVVVDDFLEIPKFLRRGVD